LGFWPDLVRSAGERGERESVDLLKGEREGDSAFFFFCFLIFIKPNVAQPCPCPCQFGTFCLENIRGL